MTAPAHTKVINFVTFGFCGVYKTLQIFNFSVFCVPFRLIGIHFDHFENNSDFQFLTFPTGYMGGGSEVTVVSEDPLYIKKKIVKGIHVQEKSSGICFAHGQFKLKPSLFMPCLSV